MDSIGHDAKWTAARQLVNWDRRTPSRSAATAADRSPATARGLGINPRPAREGVFGRPPHIFVGNEERRCLFWGCPSAAGCGVWTSPPRRPHQGAAELRHGEG